MTPTTEMLYAAVKHALDRSQVDPDFGYYCGPFTETYELLCAAEAAHLGRPVDEIKRWRGPDLQPLYRKRDPEVLNLRRAITQVCSRIEQIGCQRTDGGPGGDCLADGLPHPKLCWRCQALADLPNP